jgi:hypothetical protein
VISWSASWLSQLALGETKPRCWPIALVHSSNCARQVNGGHADSDADVRANGSFMAASLEKRLSLMGRLPADMNDR